MTAPRTLRFSRDWITRPVFGVVLAAIVIGAIFAGHGYLAVAIAAVALAAAREWHRMVGEGRYGVELVATTATIWLALLAFVLWPRDLTAELILACGTFVHFAIGLSRRSHPLWQAGGVVYLGVPALCVLTLRTIPPHGAWMVMGLFIVVWATDTGALFIGTLVGGPKLAPSLSPNKTWAGTVGGVVAAAVLEAAFIAAIGGSWTMGALFGGLLGVVAHLGDLFESLVKRRFRAKDSGGLIPGHGGVLDRVDSTLAAATALAIAVFAFHLDPLFGARP